MKKILLALPALLFILFSFQLTAQTKSAKLSDKARKNLEACKKVNDAIMSGNMAALDQFIAEDAIDHAGMHGDIKGRDSIKAELSKIHSMMSDMQMEVVKELADDEYVFQWMRMTGTAKTSDMGIPAGTNFNMTAVEVTKFRDGKAVEHWEFMQPADMMKMMQGGHGMSGDSTMQK
jgi:predicted SnoaL-like aldol condensation-catalyzing enzyme